MKRFTFALVTVACIALVTCAAYAQVKMPQMKYRERTLPNGLRYYVRANGKPARRAELRLVIKAGSVVTVGGGAVTNELAAPTISPALLIATAR